VGPRRALVRLEAVWRAWEALRLEPTTGIARWLRDVADPQMDRLRDRDRGPFRGCGEGKHLTGPPLPGEQPPAGFWDQHEQKGNSITWWKDSAPTLPGPCRVVRGQKGGHEPASMLRPP